MSLLVLVWTFASAAFSLPPTSVVNPCLLPRPLEHLLLPRSCPALASDPPTSCTSTTILALHSPGSLVSVSAAGSCPHSHKGWDAWACWLCCPPWAIIPTVNGDPLQRVREAVDKALDEWEDSPSRSLSLPAPSSNVS